MYILFFFHHLGSLPGEGQSRPDLRAEVDAQDQKAVDGRGDAQSHVKQEGHHLFFHVRTSI